MINKVKYLIVPLAFFAGVYFADDVKSLRSNLYYQPMEGFYPRPYDLRIERRYVGTKVGVYLTDVSTGESHKVGPKMFVGSPSHRINSVVSLPQEYFSKKNLKTLTLILDSLFEW